MEARRPWRSSCAAGARGAREQRPAEQGHAPRARRRPGADWTHRTGWDFMPSAILRTVRRWDPTTSEWSRLAAGP